MAGATGSLRSVNPATGEELASFAEHTAGQLEAALAAAAAAQREWATTSFAERFLADEPVQTDAFASYVAYQPLGVVLAIMPWNFLWWQVLRFAAPALMAGSGALLKHSPNVPRCALAIEELFARAGFPQGLFRTLLVADASVGEATGRLLADPRIGAVTLTGSERAGAAVGATAGRALKKCVLELGGSDPSSSSASSTPRPPSPSATRWTRRRGSGRWPGPTWSKRWNARSRARWRKGRECCWVASASTAPGGSTPPRS